MQTETYEFISYALNTNLSKKSFRTYCFKIISFKLICLKTNIPWKCLLQGQNWNQTIFWFKTKDIEKWKSQWKVKKGTGQQRTNVSLWHQYETVGGVLRKERGNLVEGGTSFYFEPRRRREWGEEREARSGWLLMSSSSTHQYKHQ